MHGAISGAQEKPRGVPLAGRFRGEKTCDRVLGRRRATAVRRGHGRGGRLGQDDVAGIADVERIRRRRHRLVVVAVAGDGVEQLPPAEPQPDGKTDHCDIDDDPAAGFRSLLRTHRRLFVLQAAADDFRVKNRTPFDRGAGAGRRQPAVEG
jgi:hypothetical protein